MEEVRLPQLKLCPAFARLFRAAAKALGTPDVAAIAIAGVLVKVASDKEIVPGSPEEKRMILHEREHFRQSAGFAPWWARPLPLPVRAALGAPKYLRHYVELWERFGYISHPYEIAARFAAGE